MIVIEKVDFSYSQEIFEIARSTFSETFLMYNTAENLAVYLQENINLKKINSQLRDSKSIFFVAKSGIDIVGYLKLNLSGSQTELNDNFALEIERIYVLKEYQNQKTGQLFVDKAIEIASEMNLQYIFLGVWEHNLKAIKFYKKNNFEVFDTHFFRIGADIQTDFLMKMYL